MNVWVGGILQAGAGAIYRESIPAGSPQLFRRVLVQKERIAYAPHRHIANIFTAY